MNILQLSTTDASWNLAAEEYVFGVLAPRFGDFFMLWRNASAVIVGKHQNTRAEVNLPYTREHGIQVIRRLSGGGAVYHDLGNLNFTFVVQNSPQEQVGKVSAIDFGRFCRPVIAALRSLGVNAELSGRNDMTLAGRKFSGNAQYQREGRTMHHGTLMFNSNLDTVAQVLRISPENEKLRNKGVASVRSRVTNIAEHMPEPCTLEEFEQRLVTELFRAEDTRFFELQAPDREAIQQLVTERYGTWEWNIGREMTFDLVRRRRFETCGTVEFSLNVRNGVITAAAISGDFFADRNPTEICEKLTGLPLRPESIHAALSEMNIGTYIRNLNLNELVDLLTME